MFVSTLLNVVGTTGSVLIKEVLAIISEVLNPLCLVKTVHAISATIYGCG